jgi:hypothetical protein
MLGSAGETSCWHIAARREPSDDRDDLTCPKRAIAAGIDANTTSGSRGKITQFIGGGKGIARFRDRW